MLGGTVFREPIILERIPRPVPGWTSTGGDEALLENIQWDEDVTPEPSSEARKFIFSSRRSTHTRWPTSPILEDEDDLPTPRPDRPGERTPLLAPRGSSSHLSLGLPPPITSQEEDTRHHAALVRRISTTSPKAEAIPCRAQHVRADSTYLQRSGPSCIGD